MKAARTKILPRHSAARHSAAQQAGWPGFGGNNVILKLTQSGWVGAGTGLGNSEIFQLTIPAELGEQVFFGTFEAVMDWYLIYIIYLIHKTDLQLQKIFEEILILALLSSACFSINSIWVKDKKNKPINSKNLITWHFTNEQQLKGGWHPPDSRIPSNLSFSPIVLKPMNKRLKIQKLSTT